MHLHHSDSLFQAVVCLWGGAGEKHLGGRTLDVLDTLRLVSWSRMLGVYDLAQCWSMREQQFDVMKHAAAGASTL